MRAIPGHSSRIEKTHLHFCKRYLEVHNKSSNVACRSELGGFPLIVDINKKILNYLNYLQEKDKNFVVKQSLKISVDLHHNGQNIFYSSLKRMTDYYDFPGFNCNLLNECKIKQLLVFSFTPFKIDQNKGQNRSIDKVQNMGNERGYIYKDPRQDSG